jgi:hypothetical protein
MAIAVNVGHESPAGGLMSAADAGGGRDIFELPIALITIKHIAPFQIAEIQIAKAIAVDITGGNPSAIEQVLVFFGTVITKMIRESDAGLGSGH